MQEKVKKQISEAARVYIEEKQLSVNELARRAEINQSYVSQMLGGKGENIADKWYQRLAKTIGYAMERNYWDHVATPQYRAIIGYLEEARVTGRNRMIIAESGAGKTYTINRYVMNRPGGTYKVTVSGQHTLPQLVNDLCIMLALDNSGHYALRIRAIANRLSLAQFEGTQPLLIIDEAENMDLRTFGALKLLYDSLEGTCPIVLIGTEQIDTKIAKMIRLNATGMPQFQRRFKAGRRVLPPIDKTFKLFLDEKVEDTRLKNLLRRLCLNYGELHDYLETALKDADAMGQPLTYEIFCDIHCITNR